MRAVSASNRGRRGSTPKALLLAGLTVCLMAVTGGVAAADVDSVDWGEPPAGAEEFDGRFVILNADNEPARSGPRVAFFVGFECTDGEQIGFLVNAEQGGTEGTGGGRAECTGDPQHAVIVAQRNQGEPNYTSGGGDLGVKGIGATDTRTGINDIVFAEDDLTFLLPGVP